MTFRRARCCARRRAWRARSATRSNRRVYRYIRRMGRRPGRACSTTTCISCRAMKATAWRSPGRRRTRRARSWPSTLRRYASHSAGAEQAHALARRELLVGFLHDRAHLAAVELDGDLERVLLGRLVLQDIARHAAGHATQHRGDARARAVPDLAAADAADRAAGRGAKAGLAALELHWAHGIDRRHAHRLLPA